MNTCDQYIMNTTKICSNKTRIFAWICMLTHAYGLPPSPYGKLICPFYHIWPVIFFFFFFFFFFLSPVLEFLIFQSSCLINPAKFKKKKKWHRLFMPAVFIEILSKANIRHLRTLMYQKPISFVHHKHCPFNKICMLSGTIVLNQ